MGLILLLTWAGAGYANEEMTVELPGGATMEFVWIEPGTFTMGSTEEQEQSLRSRGMWIDWFENEHPAHEVRISQGFWLGKYEITQSQWEAGVGINPSYWLEKYGITQSQWEEGVEINPSYFKGIDRPVENISWDDVQEFLDLLNDEAGGNLYRLPTEAEWEYACRAGISGLWSFGDDESLIGDYAWYYDNNSPTGTKEVGTRLPNPWGLYDMYGNVWEWCQDKWAADYYSNSPNIDPAGPAAGSNRVLRGGHFFSFARGGRSALRDFYARDDQLNIIGARLLWMGAKPTAVNSESWGRIKVEY